MFANHVGDEQVSPPQAQKRRLGRRAVAGFGGRRHRSPAPCGDRVGRGRRPGPVTTMRRYSTVRVPLAAVDSVCRKFGVTANDVALAAITEGFRTVLLHRGEQPRADSLRTLVPMTIAFGHAAVSARRARRSGAATADRAQPLEGQARRRPARSPRPSLESGDQPPANYVARQGNSTAEPASATRHRDAGDQRARASPPVAADGPDDGALAADPARRLCS